MLVCVFLCAACTRDRGCSAHPVFPAPSVFRGAQNDKTSGAFAPREGGVVIQPSSFRGVGSRSPESILPIVVMDPLMCNCTSQLATLSRPGMTDEFVFSSPQNKSPARGESRAGPFVRSSSRTSACAAPGPIVQAISGLVLLDHLNDATRARLDQDARAVHHRVAIRRCAGALRH